MFFMNVVCLCGAEGETDRERDRQRERQTDRERKRETDRQTDVSSLDGKNLGENK